MPEASFDAVAASYDTNFTHTVIGKLQRGRVWNFLKRDLSNQSKLKILEINCGTGLDALWLNQLGHHVIATDVSSKMIEEAKKRTAEVRFEVVDFGNLVSTFEPNSFDVIFSNFAGLNCVNAETLIALQRDFAALLKPKGQFIGVFLGKLCWIERLYFTWKRKPDLARRRSGVNEANLDDVSTQQTWCYSESELMSIFNCFSVSNARSIGLFVPPSYMENKVANRPLLIRLLLGLEILFGGRRWGADEADHIYLSMLKK